MRDMSFSSSMNSNSTSPNGGKVLTVDTINPNVLTMVSANIFFTLVLSTYYFFRNMQFAVRLLFAQWNWKSNWHKPKYGTYPIFIFIFFSNLYVNIAFSPFKEKEFPFSSVIKANIGDAHAMGQTPITFIR
jgi:hypothetical protein